MVEIDLVSHIKQNTPLVSGRVFPQLMPQNSETPSIVYSVTYDSDIETLGCAVGKNIRFQVDVYSYSYAEVKATKEQVKTALYSFKHKVMDLSTNDLYEDDTKLHRQRIDFKFKI